MRDFLLLPVYLAMLMLAFVCVAIYWVAQAFAGLAIAILHYSARFLKNFIDY